DLTIAHDHDPIRVRLGWFFEQPRFEPLEQALLAGDRLVVDAEQDVSVQEAQALQQALTLDLGEPHPLVTVGVFCVAELHAFQELLATALQRLYGEALESRTQR